MALGPCGESITFRCLMHSGHAGDHGWREELESTINRGLEILRKLEATGDKPIVTPTEIVKVNEQQENEQQGELMPIYVSGGTKRTFTPAPEGIHNAVCVDVDDLGMKPNKFYDPSDPKSKKELHKVRLIWEIDAKDEETGKRHTVAQTFTGSIHEKSNLGKLLAKWRGRPFTEEEMARFDIETLIGVPCQLEVKHNIGGEGEVYANVQSVAAFKAEINVGGQVVKMKPIKPSPDYVRAKDRPKNAAEVPF